ncbi:MAG: histidine kinase dimerization/phospho-acceptor domain-containing protein [Candidatus Krumholzibacteria bacterium]|jgi:signal transduction histidine kinase/PAS domain-containing protein|nr:histidine kinase dimerization/phospho-acceptor domain-containing protein [Candidatus Krumholzibacteria bacterium]MDP6669026.1 histidine kinase dimerization/phospho-acceptor domain-containing protein [Candidatus Krumholzibacteria bacterium]MDP6796304.1 histidine kinase dimerization/phospho-acceptor domain-containing protein [Candidatus Krumholzibacteria bacterium]MDP7020965.1 histidine kinase dimerization/phospho-acceptor domain-containing protein [Candidatus Krumholzibacteria bacterium]
METNWSFLILSKETQEDWPREVPGWDLRLSSLEDCPASDQTGVDLLMLDLSPGDPALLPWLLEFRQFNSGALVLLAERESDPGWFRSAVRLGVDDLIQIPLSEGEWQSYLEDLGEVLEAGNEQSIQRGHLEKSGQKLLESRNQLSRMLLHSYENLDSLNRELNSRVGQLTILYQLGRDLSSQDNWDDALDHFLATSLETLDFSGASLLLWSFEGRRLASRANVLLEGEVLDRCIEVLMEMEEEDRSSSSLFALHEGSRLDEESLRGRSEPWHLTVLPLVHAGEAQGFLAYRKAYESAESFEADLHFLKTVQTILSEALSHAKAVHQLKKLGEFNRTVLESVRASVLTLDGFGQISYRNPSASSLFGDLLSPGMPFRFDEYLRSGDGAGDLGEEDWIQRECLFRSGAESPRHLLLSTTHLHPRHPQDAQTVLVFEDLTEYKRLETELRRAERLAGLGQLSAGVAHEIRNPLSGISMIAQLLKDLLEDSSEEMQSYVDRILAETQRLNRIVQNLLDFSKPATPLLAPLTVSQLLQPALEHIRASAEKKGIRIELPQSGLEQKVMCDRDQLQQVFLNLFRNAMEACSKGDRLGLWLERGKRSGGKDRVMIRVWDSGPGVAEENVANLFNPFYTTRAAGTGLGLSICLKIMEEHGGSISYLPSAEGGSEFMIDLTPAETANPEEKQLEPNHPDC